MNYVYLMSPCSAKVKRRRVCIECKESFFTIEKKYEIKCKECEENERRGVCNKKD